MSSQLLLECHNHPQPPGSCCKPLLAVFVIFVFVTTYESMRRYSIVQQLRLLPACVRNLTEN